MYLIKKWRYNKSGKNELQTKIKPKLRRRIITSISFSMIIMSHLNNLVPYKLYEKLEKVGLTTTKDILMLSKCDIMKLINLNSDEVLYLKNTAAECFLSTTGDVMTGRQLLQNPPHYISTGCKALDIFLQGGFPCGKISEMYGESGSGKTQIALQSTVHNWRNGVIYICTEELFQIKRYDQINKSMLEFDKNIDYGENIFVEFVTEIDELISCVSYRLPSFLEARKSSLIVIDSIAGVFRSENTNYIQRAQEMRKVAMALLRLAKKFNMAILCTNQVSASFQSTKDTVIPSLGLAWSNMITTRLHLRRALSTERDFNEVLTIAQRNSQVREMSIVFSPDLPNTKTYFIITSSGVESFND